MIEFDLASQQPTATPPSVPVTVVGLGGAGANILDSIALEGLPGARLVALNTDARALQSSMLGVKLQLGHDLTRGLGAGGDPDLGAEAALASAADIREELQDQKLVFLCTGLGGGTGSGATPLVAKMAREAGAFVVVFAVMPFTFEGRRRLRQAEESLTALREHADALITFDNDRLGELVLPKKGIHEAFSAGDKVVSQSIRSLIQLVTQPGLIRIGLDELISAVGRGDRRCLFGYGAASGDNRVTEALALALKSPLLHKGELRTRGRDVLVHISGGTDLSFTEVQDLMQELNKHLHEDAKILFGAGVDAAKGDQVSLTILTSLGRDDEAEEVTETKVASTAAPTKPAAQAAVPAAPVPPAPAPAAPPTPAAPASDDGEIILDLQPSPVAAEAPLAPEAKRPAIKEDDDDLEELEIPDELDRAAAETTITEVSAGDTLTVSETIGGAITIEEPAATPPAAPTASVKPASTPTAAEIEAAEAKSLDDKAFAFAKKFADLEEEIKAQQGQAPAPSSAPASARSFNIRDLTTAREPARAENTRREPPPPREPREDRPAAPPRPASAPPRHLFFQSWRREEARREGSVEYESAGSISEFDPAPRSQPSPPPPPPPHPRPAPREETVEPEPESHEPLSPARQSPLWSRRRPDPSRGAPSQTSFDNTLRPTGSVPHHGRFENAEPTIEDGEDLDVPTFMRRKK